MNQFNKFLVAAFMSAAMLLPNLVQAQSVRQYESETTRQKATDQIDAIYKIKETFAKTNPALSQAINDYFTVSPPGQVDPPGFIAFQYDLDDLDTLAAHGKADLDKIQIEGLLLGIVKRDVMPRFATSGTPSPAAPATPFNEAMSVRQFQNENNNRQLTDASYMIFQITAEVAKVNPAVSQAIHDYFSVTPPGQLEAAGMIKFWRDLREAKNLEAKGKFDPDKVTIKALLLALIKTDVMPKFPQPATTPPATAPAAPAAPPHPAAAPSSPPASSPDDDPIGGGGFITPPTSFNALLCVSTDVANNSSWSKPEAGSKMDAFKNMAADYIISVAKPGWEYWIVQGRYERFDPATTTSGGQFVSSVSPDSGRFDEFDPKCPSGYAAFWVKVSH